MKKKLISLAGMLGIIVTFIPSALAVNYPDFVGSFYTGNSDGTGYAALDIHTCDASSITLDFYRIKNDVVAYTYTFGTGSVSGDKAVIPFTATMTSSGATFTGKMDLTFQGGMIKIDLKSNLGSEMYNGTLPKVNRSMMPVNGTAPAAPPAAVITPPPAATASPVRTGLPEVRVKLNDGMVSFAKGAGPFIENDRTYVPLRSVFYEMGINVYWDEYQATDILRGQQITCTKDGMIVQLARTRNDSGENKWTMKKWVDSDTSQTNYASIDIIDQQPKIVNDTAYLPLRVISEAFGAHVNWIGSTKTVDISCDTSNTCWYDKETISKMETFSLTDAQPAITDDYSNVVIDTTPYYAPEAKFYQFKATDQYGAVKLRVYYGGYLNAFPDTDAAPAAPAEATPQADAAAPSEAETTAAPDAAVTDTPPSDTSETENGEEEVFVFDMTQLLNESENGSQGE